MCVVLAISHINVMRNGRYKQRGYTKPFGHRMHRLEVVMGQEMDDSEFHLCNREPTSRADLR